MTGSAWTDDQILPRIVPAAVTPQISTWNWITERVDAPKMFRDIGTRSLAPDSAGQAHISYYDCTNDALKYAHAVPWPFHFFLPLIAK
jgi:hypothetical protein